jgi:hypothetical protein
MPLGKDTRMFLNVRIFKKLINALGCIYATSLNNQEQ